MDKSNFKKLALMGMAGGMILASQTPANAEVTHCDRTIMMGHAGCGAGSCGAQKARGPAASCGGQQRASCAGQRPERYYTADAQSDVNVQMQQRNASPAEIEFERQLGQEALSIWRGLDPAGKALALRLAAQMKRDEAVREAAQRIAQERANRPAGYNYNQY